MVLEVEHLRVAFRTEKGLSVPVRDVSFSIPENGRVALVGESGCGKSLTALTVGGLVDRAEIEGRISRPSRIAYVFQNPMQSLNPVMRVGKQVEEGMEGRSKVACLLSLVGLPSGTEKKYPCELSGGQQHRTSIGRSLITRPSLVLADEPTGNLDTKSTKEIMEIFEHMHEMGRTIILVTHEPEIAACASRQLLVRDGRITRDEGKGVVMDVV